MQVQVEPDTSGDILAEPLQCESIEVVQAKPVSLSRTSIQNLTDKQCLPGCTLSVPLTVSGQSQSKFSIQGLKLDRGLMELRTDPVRKTLWTLLLPAHATATLLLPGGTTLRSNAVSYEISSESVQKITASDHLEMRFVNCEPPQFVRRDVSGIRFAEPRSAGFAQSHLLLAKIRFLAFKKKSVEVQQGGHVDMSDFPGVVHSLQIRNGEIAGRAEGEVKALNIRHGRSPRDHLPSLLEWTLEWHFIEVVLASILTVFGVALKLVNWYDKERT